VWRNIHHGGHEEHALHPSPQRGEERREINRKERKSVIPADVGIQVQIRMPSPAAAKGGSAFG
jgi:hypothetical protein